MNRMQAESTAEFKRLISTHQTVDRVQDAIVLFENAMAASVLKYAANVVIEGAKRQGTLFGSPSHFMGTFTFSSTRSTFVACFDEAVGAPGGVPKIEIRKLSHNVVDMPVTILSGRVSLPSGRANPNAAEQLWSQTAILHSGIKDILELGDALRPAMRFFPLPSPQSLEDRILVADGGMPGYAAAVAFRHALETLASFRIDEMVENLEYLMGEGRLTADLDVEHGVVASKCSISGVPGISFSDIDVSVAYDAGHYDGARNRHPAVLIHAKPQETLRYDLSTRTFRDPGLAFSFDDAVDLERLSSIVKKCRLRRQLATAPSFKPR